MALSDDAGSGQRAGAGAFRWLCGGVGVDHRLLSEFRAGQCERIGRLLADHVASLSVAGLIVLDEIAQDGVRLRANAGAASLRRLKTLEGELTNAKAPVENLARDEDDDPGASSRRRQAARERTAAERETRVAAALAALGEAEKLRERRLNTNKAHVQKQKEPRASTTDPQARVMKMADGGFRPDYNVQFASLPQNSIVVAVSCETAGSDRGLAEPMARAIKETCGCRPGIDLVDGGYLSADDIEAAAKTGTKMYCPPTKTKSDRDAFAPRDEDSDVVAKWRAHMASEEGKKIYQRRSRCELIHAKLRKLGLDRLLPRAKQKVAAWMRWFALACNIMTEARLRVA